IAVLGARAASKEGAPAGSVLATAAALSLAVATSALSDRPAWAAAARTVFALAATVIAVRALASMEGDAGLAARASMAEEPSGIRAKAIGQGGVAFVVLAWGTAAFVDAAAWGGASSAWAAAAPVAAAGLGA